MPRISNDRGDTPGWRPGGRAACRSVRLVDRELAAADVQHEHRQGDQHNRSPDHQDAQVRHGLELHHQQAGERGDGNVEQKLHGQAMSLEVNSHHGPELQVNEQQEDVFDGRVPLLDHADVSVDRGPDDGSADNEQGHEVESTDQLIPNIFPEISDPHADLFDLRDELVGKILRLSHVSPPQ